MENLQQEQSGQSQEAGQKSEDQPGKQETSANTIRDSLRANGIKSMEQLNALDKNAMAAFSRDMNHYIGAYKQVVRTYLQELIIFKELEYQIRAGELTEEMLFDTLKRLDEHRESVHKAMTEVATKT